MNGLESQLADERSKVPATAVLAGCGDLGIRIGNLLFRLGYRVLGLRRRPERLPAHFDGDAVDLRHQRPRLPNDTTLIIVALTADGRSADAYRDTYVTGLGRVLDAEQELAVRPRVLLVSSTAVHGVTDGGWVDERSPAVPATATGARLRAAEELLHARRPDAVVLRLAGLYGNRNSRLVSSVRDGTATIPLMPRFTNRIHRDDAAGAIVHLATRVADPEPVYLGVDHEPAEQAAVLRFVARQLGLAPPPIAAERDGDDRGKRCRGDRLRATGYVFAHPTYRDGYRAILGSAA